MPKGDFQTVPDELLPAARSAVAYFNDRGYKVRIEPPDVDHPKAAQIVAKRQQTTVIVIIDKSPVREKIEAWCGYCKSSGKDTRLTVVTDGPISEDDRNYLRDKQVGHLCKRDNDLVEELAPADLAMNVVLPPLEVENAQVRQLLGSSYDHFRSSRWREGFDEACETFEEEARKYFKRWQNTGRIKIVKKGVVTTVPAKALNKLPIGPLIILYSVIQSKNATDSVIERVLRQIKKDRNDRRHRRNQPKTENKLRANVGRHMYSILAGLRAIHA